MKNKHTDAFAALFLLLCSVRESDAFSRRRHGLIYGPRFSLLLLYTVTPPMKRKCYVWPEQNKTYRSGFECDDSLAQPMWR